MNDRELDALVAENVFGNAVEQRRCCRNYDYGDVLR